MSGINKVILVGRMGQDPEVKALPSGGYVANVSVATSESWKDKNTGEKKESVEWHRVIFFNKLAEIVGEYLKKGAHVYVEGRLQTRKWKDKEGVERYTTEIIASTMQMLGGAASYTVTTQGGGGSGKDYNKRSDANAGAPAFDDDIPF